jgi:hypothetical protein
LFGYQQKEVFKAKKTPKERAFLPLPEKEEFSFNAMSN